MPRRGNEKQLTHVLVARNESGPGERIDVLLRRRWRLLRHEDAAAVGVEGGRGEGSRPGRGGRRRRRGREPESPAAPASSAASASAASAERGSRPGGEGRRRQHVVGEGGGGDARGERRGGAEVTMAEGRRRRVVDEGVRRGILKRGEARLRSPFFQMKSRLRGALKMANE